MSAEYWQLLRDPRWQKKRLEVMQRDEFSCATCGNAAATLNVHHIKYRKGAKPWEYDADELQTLCENCHSRKHELEDQLKVLMSKLYVCDIKRLIGFTQAQVLFDNHGSSVALEGEMQICGIRSWLDGLGSREKVEQMLWAIKEREGKLTHEAINRIVETVSGGA